MRQFLALFVAVVFALSFAGLAAAQGTQTAPGGGSSGTPSTEPPKSSTPGGTSPSGAAPSGSDTGKSTTEQPKAGTAGKSGTEMQHKAATGTKAGAKTASARSSHKMMGEVTKIDSAKGMVTVKTAEGDLDLHFPPSALQGMKEGDRVEVQLSIRPAAAAKSGETGKAPAAKSGVPASKPKTSSGDTGMSSGTPGSKPAEQPKTQ